MISLLIKSYLMILISVGLGAFFLFSFGIYLIFRFFSVTPPKRVVPQHELASIAGDDLVATQLDLARAYLETDNYSAAIKLLKFVDENGTSPQQNEAKQFIKRIKKISR